MRHDSWLERARDLDVLQVAHLLGLEVTRSGSSHSLSPCPVCGAARRHTKRRDRRGAVGVRPDLRGWRCFQCDRSGDSIDLVALFMVGRRVSEASSEERAVLEAWYRDHLLLGASRTARFDSPRLADRGPPPLEEVLDLWDRAAPLDGKDVDLLQWIERRFVPDHVASAERLKHRQMVVHAIDALDLARVVPRGAAVPEWAVVVVRREPLRTIPWSETRYRLLLPLYDAEGVMVSLSARAIPGTRGRPKSLPAFGHARRGLLWANPAARSMLEAVPTASSGSPSSDGGRARPRVVIAEGEPDYLTWAARTDAEDPLAVLGISSGSWTPVIAARIPSNARVIVRNHRDVDGERYARKIRASLAGERRVWWLGPAAAGHHVDDNDRLQAGELPADPEAGTRPMEPASTTVSATGPREIEALRRWTLTARYGVDDLRRDRERRLVPVDQDGAVSGTRHVGWGAHLARLIGGGLAPGEVVAVSGDGVDAGAFVMQLADARALWSAEAVARGDRSAVTTPVVLVTGLDPVELTWQALARWTGADVRWLRAGATEASRLGGDAGVRAWVEAEAALASAPVNRARSLMLDVPPGQIDRLEERVDQWMELCTADGLSRFVHPFVVVEPMASLERSSADGSLQRLIARLADLTARRRWVTVLLHEAVPSGDVAVALHLVRAHTNMNARGRGEERSEHVRPVGAISEDVIEVEVQVGLRLAPASQRRPRFDWIPARSCFVPLTVEQHEERSGTLGERESIL